MALADLSFKLYSDAGLTTLAPSMQSIIHNSDFSDNDQDFVFYFGSPSSNVQLQTTTNPGTDNITITPTDALPAWTASNAYALGRSVEPVSENGFRYEVITAGTSGSAEPTWPTSIGSQVTDGGVVWECVSATHNPTEIKLAATNAGLASAVAGAALSLGTSIAAGSANAKQIHMRVTNAVTQVENNSADPEISLNINNVTESAV